MYNNLFILKNKLFNIVDLFPETTLYFVQYEFSKYLNSAISSHNIHRVAIQTCLIDICVDLF